MLQGCLWSTLPLSSSSCWAPVPGRLWTGMKMLRISLTLLMWSSRSAPTHERILSPFH